MIKHCQRAVTHNMNLKSTIESLKHDRDTPRDEREDRLMLAITLAYSSVQFHEAPALHYKCGILQKMQRAIQIYHWHRAKYLRELSLELAEKAVQKRVNLGAIMFELEKILSEDEFKNLQEMVRKLKDIIPVEYSCVSVVRDCLEDCGVSLLNDLNRTEI